MNLHDSLSPNVVQKLWWMGEVSSLILWWWLFLLLLWVSAFLIHFIVMKKLLSFSKLVPVYLIILSSFFVLLSVSFIAINIFWENYNFSAWFFERSAFQSLLLVSIYYLWVAFIEESSKYNSFISVSESNVKSANIATLHAVYIALWFSFFENILYAFLFLDDFWWSLDTAGLMLMRGIFSIFVHIVASSFLAYFFFEYFSWIHRQYMLIKKIFYLSGIMLMVIGYHASYDVLLNYNADFILIMYFLLGYFWITKLIYSR